MQINAHLAAKGDIAVKDSRIEEAFIVGSMVADTIDLNKINFTEDPRMYRAYEMAANLNTSPYFAPKFTMPKIID